MAAPAAGQSHLNLRTMVPSHFIRNGTFFPSLKGDGYSRAGSIEFLHPHHSDLSGRYFPLPTYCPYHTHGPTSLLFVVVILIPILS